jgi:hypothetical protein
MFIDYVEVNNVVLSSINEYALEYDRKCIEGEINEYGIVLSFSGKLVDKNKSYSNMKGGLFNKELIEYKKDNCILNKEDNLDKYIISGNKIDNNISIVIDVVNNKSYESMISILNKYNLKSNLLVSDSFTGSGDVLLYKGKNIKEFKNKHDSFYCTGEIIDICKKEKINTIRIMNYIDDNLFFNIKKFLNNGNIIFIKESSNNLSEFEIVINYIKSRGFNIVSIDELLS